ncbi:MAG: TlyA family RNA methyltransferase [Deltaproteobacteria bacterium]|nr:TlyA family RNA methyltransferase [Deltaproteobacteria bacterium]
MSRVRVDALLVERGLAPTRERAQALILAGLVVVDDHRVSKPAERVATDAALRLKGEVCPYVSRGGLKLAAALDAFAVDPRGLSCVDVGASTGGFTDCLLQRGARRVFAVDVGYGQLAWKLREDPRVVSLERQNIRTLLREAIPEPVDLVVADTSFISLRLVLPKVGELLSAGGDAIVLVKPQFEVGKGLVGKGGVVRDAGLRHGAVEQVCRTAEEVGFEVLGTLESPAPGAKKGNIEYLVHLRRRRMSARGG